MLNANRLATFLAVVRLGSVTAAAEELTVTPPTVSAAITGLERDLGVPLFAREGRRLSLTAAGMALAQWGPRFFSLFTETTEAVRSAAEGTPHPLRIAVIPTVDRILAQLLPGFLAAVLTQVAVEVRIEPTDAAWRALQNWEVELTIGTLPPADVPTRRLGIRRGEYIVVGRSAGSGTPAALADQMWFVREPGSASRATVDEFFRLCGIAPRTVMMSSTSGIRECVLAGLGLALLHNDAVQRELVASDLVVIPTSHTPQPRIWYLASAAGRELSLMARKFVRHVLEQGIFVEP